MKKIFVFMVTVMVVFVGACSAKQAEPTPIPVNSAVPTADVAQDAPDKSAEEAGAERVASEDGMTQVFVPGGAFQMGGIGEKTDPDELPLHKVTISAFWMDKLEVTNSMYMLCVKAGACELPVSFAAEKHEQYSSYQLRRLICM